MLRRDLAADRREELARRYLEHVVLNPDNAADLVEIASLLDDELFEQARAAAAFAQGDLAGAAAMLRDAVSKRPVVFNVVCLAHCWVAMGRDADAIAVLEESRGRFPADPSLLLELAGARFRAGDTQEANRCLDRVKHAFAEDRREIQPLVDELNRALRDGLVERPVGADIYDELFVTTLWHTYKREYETYSWYQNNSAFIYHTMNERLRMILAAGDLEHVIDFGVMCGLPLHELVRGHPMVHFDGCDRQHLVKALNEREFPAPNLAFFDCDILDLLRTRVRAGGTLLYHARTATLCYPAFLSRLYEECFRAGVASIALLEPCSLSRDLLRFQDYEEMEEISVARRGPMFLHNYPRLLKEAGYEVVKMERLAYGHLIQPMAQAVDQFAYIQARRR